VLNEQMVAGRDRSTPPIRVAVVHSDGVWRLLLNGEGIGRFARRSDALRCALDMAGEMRSEGCAVEVLEQDGLGELAPAEGASWRPHGTTARGHA
jgi:hypothetical protein